MSACRRLDVSVLLFRWCEFGARLFGNYLTPPPGTPLPQERGFTSHLVFFQSACRRGAMALESLSKCGLLKSPGKFLAPSLLARLSNNSIIKVGDIISFFDIVNIRKVRE